MSRNYPSRKFGAFPHEVIGRTLDVDLEPGNCYVSSRAHQHIAEDHPRDYPIIWAHLERVVAEPTFIGQAPHHTENFEMVKRIRIFEEDESGTTLREYYALIAVSFECDRHGDYRVVSGYLLKEEEVTTRRLNNHLVIPKK